MRPIAIAALLCLSALTVWAQSNYCNRGPCLVDEDCQDEYHLCCNGICSVTGAVNTSMPRLKAGEECNLEAGGCAAPCELGLSCLNGVCAGDTPIGCPCSSDDDCANSCSDGVCDEATLDVGEPCDDNNECVTNICDQTKLICAPLPISTLGMPCSQYQGCDTGLYCGPGPVQFSEVCAAKVALGGSCIPNYNSVPCPLNANPFNYDVNPCANGGVCLSDGAGGYSCAAGGQLNAACDDTNRCAEGLACWISPNNTAGTCVARCSLPDATPCVDDVVCRNGCVQGSCGVPSVRGTQPGGACTQSADCDGVLPACINNVCQELNGMACTLGSDATGQCGAGHCRCAADGSGMGACFVYANDITAAQATCAARFNAFDVGQLIVAGGGNNTRADPNLRVLRADYLCCQGCSGIEVAASDILTVDCSTLDMVDRATAGCTQQHDMVFNNCDIYNSNNGTAVAPILKAVADAKCALGLHSC